MGHRINFEVAFKLLGYFDTLVLIGVSTVRHAAMEYSKLAYFGWHQRSAWRLLWVSCVQASEIFMSFVDSWMYGQRTKMCFLLLAAIASGIPVFTTRCHAGSTPWRKQS